MGDRRRQRPNVLFIMSDQHRYDYMSCAGVSACETPNLDALAARGTRFTTCTTNSPVCAPARIGLASGLQPFRLGSLGNNSFLPLGTPTYYQLFRDQGYRVGCVGKLDLAKPDHYNGRYGDRPRVYEWGFTHPEEVEGKNHGGTSRKPLGPYGHYLKELGLLDRFVSDYDRRRASHTVTDMSQDSVLPTEAFADAYIGRRAAEWISAVPDDYPWFYFCSFVGPHDPFDPPTEYADRYRDREMPDAIPDDLGGKPEWVRDRVARHWHYAGPDPDEIPLSRRQYCAATTLIDDQIGSMLQALEQRGGLDDTIIVYTSDHGEMLADHGLYTKHYAYEASLRVPLLMAGPGVPEGHVSDALVELIDAHATVTDLAGLPALLGSEALSLAPLFDGNQDEHRGECLSTIHEFQLVRTDRYKFVNNFADVPELYDLQEDPQELRNLAPEESALCRELARLLLHRAYEAPWPR
jgi:arylsulfatase